MATCYGAPTKLMFREQGICIFNLAIHSIITQLTSDLNIWYFDDGTIGGRTSSVLADLKTITDRFAEIGLTINSTKLYISETISANDRATILTTSRQILQ